MTRMVPFVRRAPGAVADLALSTFAGDGTRYGSGRNSKLRMEEGRS